MNAERLLRLYERIADTADAVARLRRFILALAVHGRLVPQDEADEHAAELLKRMAVEKARLIKVRAIRKPRHLAEADDCAEPFDIPTSWRWCRLDAVGAIIGGGTPSSGDSANFDEPGNGIPWLTPADLGGYRGLYIRRGSRDLSEKGLSSSSATLMPAGTVLFTSRAPIGYVAIAANPISTNQGFKSVVPYVTECSPFIALAMQAFAPGINATAPGTTFKEVSGKIVAGVPFPLPPLAEQHRIVAKVDELMALCDQLGAARAKREAVRDRLTTASFARFNSSDPDPVVFRDHARFALDALPAITARPDQIAELRQAILDVAIRGGLVSQDPTDEPAVELLKRIGEEARQAGARLEQGRNHGRGGKAAPVRFKVPRGWEWTHLGALSLEMRYGTAKKCHPEPVGTPVLRIPNVSQGRISLENLKFGDLSQSESEKLSLRRGDLLCIRSNGSLDIVGRSVEVDLAAQGMSFAGYLLRVRLSVANVLPRFVQLAMSTRYLRDQIEKPIRSTVGLKNVNSAEFAALVLPLPPLSEQRRIVAKIDDLTSLCDQLEASLATGDIARRRLLEAVVDEALASRDVGQVEAGTEGVGA